MKKGKYLATFWQDCPIFFAASLSFLLIEYNCYLSNDFYLGIKSELIIYPYSKNLYDSLFSSELPNCRQPTYLCALCALANDI